MAKPIWIIDDITVNPGQGPAFVDAHQHVVELADRHAVGHLHRRR